MKINDPYVYLLPNNESFTIIQNSQGLVLVNLKLIVFNATVNGNISFYRQSKPTFEFIYPIVTPVSQTKQQSNQQSSTVSQTKQQTIFRNKNNKSRIPASTIKHVNTSRPESIIINKLKSIRR